MSLLVDTSVWSLAFRRDVSPDSKEVKALRSALEQGESVVCTGLIFQELLQGFAGSKSRDELLRHFSALPIISPNRTDHVEAAELRNHCRRKGVQLGTIDALIAQLCIRHDLTLLSVDADFRHAARFCPLRNWGAR
ncbi:MAG TPA: PIN domain-containing protein [Xanthomonadaceae bacterium]|nr:PIN domain-containing protein [Xanthomonadaceae bacterium]